MKLAPSILAADLADLAGAAATCEAGGADLIHVDVMDGHFVPNLTFGAPVVEALAGHTRLPLDVHLMVDNPERLLDEYLKAGADWISVHWEASAHLDRLLGRIRSAGARAGVAINPATPVEFLVDVLPAMDHALIMSVNPGFAGQRFIDHALDKARRLRELIEGTALEVVIQMDGGLDLGNLRRAIAAGVEVAVIGSGIFAASDAVARMRQLRAVGTEEVLGGLGDTAER